MRCILSTTNDPHYNLATEEFFLKNSTEDIFMLYHNEPCIVIGKHQNLLSEINLKYVFENKIHLARRISGGGTVFQDLNNLNYSFIHSYSNPDQINYVRYLIPIIDALTDMDLKVTLSSRHDILIGSNKISGNAMHIFKNRVLFHGTLLFDTNLEKLSKSLQNDSTKYYDKSIKSVKSNVDNISHHLNFPIDIHHFTKKLFQYIKLKSNDTYTQLLDEKENMAISNLSINKFMTWDWIYGNSPPYLFQNSFYLSKLLVKLEMKVEKGIIRSINTTLDPILHRVCYDAFQSLVDYET